MSMAKNIFKKLEKRLKTFMVLMLNLIIISVTVIKFIYLSLKIFSFHQKLKHRMIII